MLSTVPLFKNRENEKVNLPDGREVWLSRSCAVVGAVFMDVYKEGGGQNEVARYVLIEKRGPACPDNVGKWVMPCGYLDYDETLGEAAVREVFEETGLNLMDLPRFKDSSFATSQPVFVSSQPSEGRQNVTHIFAMSFRVHHTGSFFSIPDAPALTPGMHGVPGEVDDARWVPMEEIKNYDMAFGHAERIKQLTNRIR